MKKGKKQEKTADVEKEKGAGKVRVGGKTRLRVGMASGGGGVRTRVSSLQASSFRLRASQAGNGGGATAL